MLLVTVCSEVVKQTTVTKGERKDIKAVYTFQLMTVHVRNLGVQALELDYNKPDTLSADLSGVDKLFLLTPFQSNMVDLTSIGRKRDGDKQTQTSCFRTVLVNHI